MDGQTDGRTDSWTDERMDGKTDGLTDGRTDKAFHRVACPQLKRDRSSFLICKMNGSSFHEEETEEQFVKNAY